jgi:hypothetical protein
MIRMLTMSQATLNRRVMIDPTISSKYGATVFKIVGKKQVNVVVQAVDNENLRVRLKPAYKSPTWRDSVWSGHLSCENAEAYAEVLRSRYPGTSDRFVVRRDLAWPWQFKIREESGD